MANYEDEKDRIVSVVSKLLEQQVVHGELARKVGIELGYILEPLIRDKVKEVLSKTEVRFSG